MQYVLPSRLILNPQATLAKTWKIAVFNKILTFLSFTRQDMAIKPNLITRTDSCAQLLAGRVPVVKTLNATLSYLHRVSLDERRCLSYSIIWFTSIYYGRYILARQNQAHCHKLSQSRQIWRRSTQRSRITQWACKCYFPF